MAGALTCNQAASKQQSGAKLPAPSVAIGHALPATVLTSATGDSPQVGQRRTENSMYSLRWRDGTLVAVGGLRTWGRSIARV